MFCERWGWNRYMSPYIRLSCFLSSGNRLKRVYEATLRVVIRLGVLPLDKLITFKSGYIGEMCRAAYMDWLIIYCEMYMFHPTNMWAENYYYCLILVNIHIINKWKYNPICYNGVAINTCRYCSNNLLTKTEVADMLKNTFCTLSICKFRTLIFLYLRKIAMWK